MRESRGWEKLMDLKACVTVSLEISLLRHFPLLLSRFFRRAKGSCFDFSYFFLWRICFFLLIQASEICSL